MKIYTMYVSYRKRTYAPFVFGGIVVGRTLEELHSRAAKRWEWWSFRGNRRVLEEKYDDPIMSVTVHNLPNPANQAATRQNQKEETT